MVNDVVIKQLPYLLHPNEAALVEWLRRNPHGRINIIAQDGIPTQAVVPTEDGLGMTSVLFSKVALCYGLR